MQIEKAPELGLCFGVRRAMKLLKEEVQKHGEMETLGPVAHNHQLIEDLAKAGIKMVNNLDEVRCKTLAITTHGASPSVLSSIKTRGIQTIDVTCPIVAKAQAAAKNLVEAGFSLVIFGDARHSEVKGLLGWANNKGTAALNIEDLNTNITRGSLLGIISQTTQCQANFRNFCSALITSSASRLKEIRIINTLCLETQRRQEAAIKLAKKVELMIVVGGYNSANTKRLAEVCSPITETKFIERADEVNSSWLVNKNHIGITAGASTPDETIDRVISKLKLLSSSR